MEKKRPTMGHVEIRLTDRGVVMVLNPHDGLEEIVLRYADGRVEVLRPKDHTSGVETMKFS